MLEVHVLPKWWGVYGQHISKNSGSFGFLDATEQYKERKMRRPGMYHSVRPTVYGIRSWLIIWLSMQVLRTFDSMISSNCTQELENVGINIWKNSLVQYNHTCTFNFDLWLWGSLLWHCDLISFFDSLLLNSVAFLKSLPVVYDCGHSLYITALVSEIQSLWGSAFHSLLHNSTVVLITGLF